ncbi:MAG: hypothetical protein PHE43_02540 [Candidatus Nanoarchaeia archaeon]|nr:hypothetical protein [Candidatus Nanoarchaeia archaeon]
MKKMIYLVLICILSSIVFAKVESIDISKDQSYLAPGHNITLLSLDSKDDKVLLCVNNERIIVSTDSTKETDNLSIDLKEVYNDETARLKLETTCKSCSCDDSCSNELCYPKQEEIIEETNEINDGTTIDTEKPIEIEVKNYKPAETKTSSNGIFIILAILIIIITVGIALSRKKQE